MQHSSCTLGGSGLLDVCVESDYVILNKQNEIIMCYKTG